ncbi:MAG: universal stress protein [Sphingobium sp.]|nr:universal stress protein [Sphingobium sp.]
MRSMLVLADASPASTVRLQAALDIARLTNGHITLHVNTPLQRFVAMDPFGGSYLLADALAEAQENEAKLIADLTATLEREDVPWDMRTSTGIAADGLLTAAMLADLIVLSLGNSDDDAASDPVRLVGDVVLASPCPVFAVPATIKPVVTTGTAIVAWSGTPESANALRAAVPLLAGARDVKLVTISNAPDFFPATDAACYLSRHGIHAEICERPHDDQPTAIALANAAEALGGDWIVMGAYGHGRFREQLFGGVTQRLLETAQLPLLLSR